MTRRTALDIKKEILKLLENKDMSLRELESKVNTNYQTIRNQIKELEFLGFLRVVRHPKNEKNGRPFSIVQLIKRQ